MRDSMWYAALCVNGERTRIQYEMTDVNEEPKIKCDRDRMNERANCDNMDRHTHTYTRAPPRGVSQCVVNEPKRITTARPSRLTIAPRTQFPMYSKRFYIFSLLLHLFLRVHELFGVQGTCMRALLHYKMTTVIRPFYIASDYFGF